MRTDAFQDGERVTPGPRLADADDLKGKSFYIVTDGRVTDDKGCRLNAMAEKDLWFSPFKE